MIKVCIVGITGYVGEELLKILSKHPNVKIVGVYGRELSHEKDLKDIYKDFDFLNLKIKPMDIKEIISSCDVVFFALPHAVTFKIVPFFIGTKVKVIDLSADFRLKNLEVYEKWYKTKHCVTFKKNINHAVYGLSELNAAEIKKACLIANPGCYPTTVILGCAPIIKSNFIDLKNIVIDSKSGISGAGRKAAKEYFDNEYPNFKPYKIAGTHRHIPEIEQELSILSGENVIVSFTPHIIPIQRGMLSTIYMNLTKNISTSFLIEKYKEFYHNKRFVRILKKDMISETKNVVNTNYCEISIKVDYRTKKLIIISAIDNLIKGASGQAVQNMNIMFNLSETKGLM
ncbi:MAG: N-acetyl-gamma-glutamyl-phosphate reductase [Endomicrobium sp.]|jgi:N-acetyl-gamma-glutamyl-phosphate reductase|nr:N-acetyl-gamma-glutamyl-phosphate reductase [Endomicrobium sp.]